MCGIYGYSGINNNAANICLRGISRLDYRGYDSWGVAVVSQGKITIKKSAGKIPAGSIDLSPAFVGIGHTRWATHGGVTTSNAHPHFSSDRQFVLAQNGIFEDYLKYKTILQKKYKFISDTDTEVLTYLIEEKAKKLSLINAVRFSFKKIRGRNTIIILTKDSQIIAARNGSPLVVGKSKTGDYYFSSDTLSIAPFVQKLLIIDNGQLVNLQNQNFSLIDIATGKKLVPHFVKNDFNHCRIDKDGYPHFMIKEIYENPFAINQVINRPQKEYEVLASVIKKAKHIYVIGSGTAGVAAAQIAYYFRSIAKINTTSLIGAESSDYLSLFTKGDVLIAPSQSGETADVLEIIEKAKKLGVKIITYVNMPGSMMSRLSDYPIMAKAGPEISVCSTKIFVSQISWGYLLAKTIANQYFDGVSNLKITSQNIEKYLKSKINHQKIKKIANLLKNKSKIFLLAKGQNRQITNEAMIKIIEVSYLHAHAIAAGDLKHFAITLVEPGIPVIFVVSPDEVRDDVENAINQVKARGGEIYSLPISTPPPTNAIANIVPLQLLAYYLGIVLGNNIDKPRHIAKSVTVK
jgi:glucosamine--fructose-6-phosphate aminotransferase (isomerizing)